MESQLGIIKQFVTDCKQSVCCIAASDALLKTVPEAVGEQFFVVNLKNDFLPYKPFLSLIAQNSPKMSYVQKAAYSVQSESFVTFFKNGIASERYDIPLDNEFVYETSRFVATICELLKKYCKKNVLVLNAQYMCEGSLSVLRELEKHNLPNKFVFCFSAESSKSSSRLVSQFLEEYNDKLNFLFVKEQLVDVATEEQSDEPICSDTIAENFTDFNTIMSDLRNNRIFMNFDQLKMLVPVAAQNMHSLSLSVLQKRQLWLEIALSYCACHQEDEAVYYFNNVIESKTEDELQIAALHYLAKIFFNKKSNDFAEKYGIRLRSILANFPKSPYVALDAMTDFQFHKRSEAAVSTAKYLRALELLEDAGFINNYISTALSIPWELINDISNKAMVDGNIQKCYDFAQKIDNRHLVSKAAHWKGIIASHYGNSDEAMKWYNECNRIRTEIGEVGPIINIRNGLSYESTCRAKYQDAYDLINGFIKNLYNVTDYSSIIDTLKNTAYALFYGRQFAAAEEIFNRILHYLHIFDMENAMNNSFLPSVGDILIFKTIIAFNKSDYVHAKTNYTSIIQDTQELTSEDKPFLFLLKALFYTESGDLQDAKTAFESCVAEFKSFKSNQAHKICFAYCEFAAALERFGHSDKATVCLKKANEFAKQKQLSYYVERTASGSVKEYLAGIKPFAPLNIDLAFLTERAEKEVLFTKLHKRIHDYKFLNKIKPNNLNSINFKEYIENALLAIFEYTLADSVCLCEHSHGAFSVIHSIARDAEPSFTDEQWKSFFKDAATAENSQLVYLPGEKLYVGNISQFEYTFVLVIVPGKKTSLTADNINTLNIAISNIQGQIIIFKQNEYLMFLSSTDQLSLLNNRHALEQYINLESDRIKRFKQRKATEIQITVAFIDLDNFKFYNDTFGHGSGDLMISLFAQLLKKTCRQIDFISRFGGDEFVVVMIDTSEQEALRFFERLKQNLTNENYFIDALKSYLNKEKLNIPDNRRLGFSMGISTNFDNEDIENLSKVVTNADKALYYSKEHNKGYATIWSSVR